MQTQQPTQDFKEMMMEVLDAEEMMKSCHDYFEIENNDPEDIIFDFSHIEF